MPVARPTRAKLITKMAAAPSSRSAGAAPSSSLEMTTVLPVDRTLYVRVGARVGGVWRYGESIPFVVVRTAATVRGPVPLPTEKHRYTVIRSPHKDKDSREHFEMRIHKRLLDILEPQAKTVDSLQRLELPAGVDIEIKILTA